TSSRAGMTHSLPAVGSVSGMDDKTLLSRINELVTEEERLLESSRGTEGLDPNEDARLKAVEVALDQCWDLLRQRRAKREAGQGGRGPAVEDDRDVVAPRRLPGGQFPGQADDGGVEVAPPAVGAGPDDVHPVDQVAIHTVEARRRSVPAMTEIRALFSQAVDAAAPLLAEPALTGRFEQPSALAEFSVRGLAGHLLRAMTSAETYLDRPQPDAGA